MTIIGLCFPTGWGYGISRQEPLFSLPLEALLGLGWPSISDGQALTLIPSSLCRAVSLCAITGSHTAIGEREDLVCDQRRLCWLGSLDSPSTIILPDVEPLGASREGRGDGHEGPGHFCTSGLSTLRSPDTYLGLDDPWCFNNTECQHSRPRV